MADFLCASLPVDDKQRNSFLDFVTFNFRYSHHIHLIRQCIGGAGFRNESIVTESRSVPVAYVNLQILAEVKFRIIGRALSHAIPLDVRDWMLFRSGRSSYTFWLGQIDDRTRPRILDFGFVLMLDGSTNRDAIRHE
ncbi:MAG: hypothetical protein RIB46_17015 [Pseudomonadales bacterium]